MDKWTIEMLKVIKKEFPAVLYDRIQANIPGVVIYTPLHMPFYDPDNQQVGVEFEVLPQDTQFTSTLIQRVIRPAANVLALEVADKAPVGHDLEIKLLEVGAHPLRELMWVKFRVRWVKKNCDSTCTMINKIRERAENGSSFSGDEMIRVLDAIPPIATSNTTRGQVNSEALMMSVANKIFNGEYSIMSDKDPFGTSMVLNLKLSKIRRMYEAHGQLFKSNIVPSMFTDEEFDIIVGGVK